MQIKFSKSSGSRSRYANAYIIVSCPPALSAPALLEQARHLCVFCSPLVRCMTCHRPAELQRVRQAARGAHEPAHGRHPRQARKGGRGSREGLISIRSSSSSSSSEATAQLILRLQQQQLQRLTAGAVAAAAG
jgi:hypothetical protein